MGAPKNTDRRRGDRTAMVGLVLFLGSTLPYLLAFVFFFVLLAVLERSNPGGALPA